MILACFLPLLLKSTSFQHDTYKSDLFIELVPATLPHLIHFFHSKLLLYILILYVMPLTAFVVYQLEALLRRSPIRNFKDPISHYLDFQ